MEIACDENELLYIMHLLCSCKMPRSKADLILANPWTNIVTGGEIYHLLCYLGLLCYIQCKWALSFQITT